eukprot:gnl/MRDRNA2_/MRDRNA2_119815_c0_seq1.p1 gnl/MRDRNA2_/MRDRNA2_119815_c0~~gnl/MRDRNA2_/MRDRNA2_119815_c0_seq1.p1  ORF type:complete len:196 (-),score=38.13 gnl/MRDRNA2_/MRDRNA2_119815_c0_seq1:177-764(-)
MAAATESSEKGNPTAAEAPAPMIVNRAAQPLTPFPKLAAEVVHGFGRGSKTLGFPTANMKVCWDKKPEAMDAHEKEIYEWVSACTPGIYYAWAQVVDGPDKGVYKTAMSVGWNPTFTDVKAKTVEPWILHDYAEDFYGCELRLIICGFVREELKFDKFDELITAIREDGDFCSEALNDPGCASAASDPFFSPSKM